MVQGIDSAFGQVGPKSGMFSKWRESRECLGESRGIAVALLESGSFQKDRGLLRGVRRSG